MKKYHYQTMRAVLRATTKVLLITALIVLVASCKKEEAEAQYLTLSETSLHVQPEGETNNSITFDTNVLMSKLSVTTDAKWLKVMVVRISGTPTLIVVAEPNDDMVNSRSASVTIAHTDGRILATLHVVQNRTEPYVEFPENAQNWAINCTASTWEWLLSTNLKAKSISVRNYADWLSVSCEETADGVVFRVSAQENVSIEERSGEVGVLFDSGRGDNRVTITQQGIMGFSTIGLNETNMKRTVSTSATTVVWEFQTNLPVEEIQASSSADWCHPQLGDVTQNIDGTTSISLSVEVDENLTDVQREADISVTAPTAANSLTFSIEQYAAQFSVSASALTFTRRGGTRYIHVNTDVVRTALCDADWVHLSQSDVNNLLRYYSLGITVDESTEERQAVITFEGIQQTQVVITQSRYAVGDTFNEDGVEATVAYIGDDYRFAYTLCGENLLWMSSGKTSAVGAFDADDGRNNMTTLQNQTKFPGLKFPAAEAALSLNRDGVTGWYLPAINELAKMKAFIKSEAWSSTEKGVTSVYAHDGNSQTTRVPASKRLNVYAIRRF